MIVADLAVGLTRRGHDVDVYAATGSLIPGARVIETGIDAGRLSAALIRPGQPRRLRARPRRRLRACLRDGRRRRLRRRAQPRLRPTGPAAGSGLGRAPVIHTVHLPPEPEAAEALREAQGASDPAIVVGVSAAQARAWSPLVTFDRVIRNGVPVSLIPWSDQPGDGLVFAGRFSAEKGAAVAIEIARLAGERIELYGAAYDEDYARDLRRRHEGDPGVTFHEPLPRADLWRRLASARAVLCPSDWDEPFGLVAAEAQAAGTPVVAFARGGLTEIIDDAVTGFLVEPGNVAGAVGGRAVRGEAGPAPLPAARRRRSRPRSMRRRV